MVFNQKANTLTVSTTYVLNNFFFITLFTQYLYIREILFNG